MLVLKSYIKLYGYALLVLLLCLSVYAGAFIGVVHVKKTGFTRVIPPKLHQKTTPPTLKAPETTTNAQKATPEEITTTPKKTMPPATPQETAPRPAQESHSTKGLTPKPTPYQVYYVAFSVVNVRAHPSTHSKVVKKLFLNQEVHVLEVKEGWARIKKGWVFLHLLKETK